MVICPNCGKNTPEGKFCEHCGASVQTTQTFQQPPPLDRAYTPQPVVVRPEKNAGLAAILSFLFTGSGQVYNGQLGKGIGFVIGAVIGAMFYFIPGVIIWLLCIYDAYATAQAMNKGEVPYVESSGLAVIAFIVVEIIILVVLFFLVLAAFIYGTSSYY
jgi:TM2 domain-containing membrane protein YozV